MNTLYILLHVYHLSMNSLLTGCTVRNTLALTALINCNIFFHVEFSRRWCTLNDGTFSYYENDKNSSPNGALKASEIVCLVADMPVKHGYTHTRSHFLLTSLTIWLIMTHIWAFSPSFFSLSHPRYDHTFELYSESERLYLFGTDDPHIHKEWVKSIAKVTIHACWGWFK